MKAWDRGCEVAVVGAYRLESRHGCGSRVFTAPLLGCRDLGVLVGKEVKRSYVCSSSLADRLGAAPSGFSIASCVRGASDPACYLIDACF